MCINCGKPSYIKCDCDQEAFCDPCSVKKYCEVKLDASCVVYHIDDDQPSQLKCLNLPNLTTVETILEQIDKLICSNGNIPITVEETYTTIMTATGVANHHLKTDVKVSEDDGNTIEIRPDGLYTKGAISEIEDTNTVDLTINEGILSADVIIDPDPENGIEATESGIFMPFKSKVDSIDPPAYLEEQFEGDTSEFLTINVLKINGKLRISPVLDLDALCEAINNCKCNNTITNLTKTFAPACPTDYDFVNGQCVRVLTDTPIVSGTPVQACANTQNSWGNFGAYVYQDGFTSYGTGQGSSLAADVSSNNVYHLNTSGVWSNPSLDNVSSALNRCGVWICGQPTGTGTFGFSVPINVPVSKVYYVGIAGDNTVAISVSNNSGVSNIVNTAIDNINYNAYYTNPYPGQVSGDGNAVNFKIWHIYPILLQAGINFVILLGTNNGSAGGFGAEIYDNTLSELMNAQLIPGFNNTTTPLNINYYSNLNLVFTTRCARQSGTIFTSGNAVCDDDTWTLDPTGGGAIVPPCQGINSDPSTWICRKTIISAFSGYSAVLVWDRIPEAVSYQVEQKLSTEPPSSYVTTAGSPVNNPTTGTTVTLNISGLPSNQMTFRIRPNYGNCFGPWFEA